MIKKEDIIKGDIYIYEGADGNKYLVKMSSSRGFCSSYAQLNKKGEIESFDSIGGGCNREYYGKPSDQQIAHYEKCEKAEKFVPFEYNTVMEPLLNF